MEEPLSPTLTIPAGVIADVREGLFCLLGGAAEAILQTLEQPDREYHPDWFHEDRRLLGQVLALLDVIGWDASREPADVQVNVPEHSATLKDAVEGYLPLLEDRVADADARASEGRQVPHDDPARRLSALRAFRAILERHPGGQDG
jgi:hypothetical protein